VTPDERELRRALDARSGEVSPEFRSRLAGALQQGRPSASALPAIALFTVIVFSLTSVGILLTARNLGQVSHGGPASGSRLASPTETQIYMPQTAHLSAPSGDVLWVFFGQGFLFRSTDRGSTWEQRPLPAARGRGYPHPEVSFVDAQQGWFSTGGVPETQCNGAGEEIWRTADGGATWQQVVIVAWTPPKQTDSGIGYAQCKEGLSFVDGTHGFLAAGDENHQPTIYQTSDGGRTWKGSSLPDPPGFVTRAGGFALRAGLVHESGSSLLVPAWGMNAATQQLEGYVFRSVDAGATWNFAAKIPSPTSSIAIVTASRWLQLIEPDQSSETMDSGKNWHAYPTDYAQAAPVAPDVLFANPIVGYATVRGSIQRTVDGGAHWVMIKTPGVYQPG
jgi:photosystem II stability/assembly factor-like uncharacterized protein